MFIEVMVYGHGDMLINKNDITSVVGGLRVCHIEVKGKELCVEHSYEEMKLKLGVNYGISMGE